MKKEEVTRFIGKVGSTLYKHRADIAYVTGIGLRATGTGMIIKGTINIVDDLKAYKPAMEAIDADDMLTDDDKVYEKHVIRYTTGKKIVKAYAPGGVVYLFGEALGALSMKSVKNDRAKAIASAAAATAALETVKERIEQQYGPDGFARLAYGTEETKEVTVRPDIPVGFLAYAFNAETSSVFEQKRGLNRLYIQQVLNDYQHAVDVFGEASFPHALKDLGFPRSVYTDPAIANYVWVYGQEVSFGLDKDSTDVKLFMKDEKPTVLLQFNCVRRE